MTVISNVVDNENLGMRSRLVNEATKINDLVKDFPDDVENVQADTVETLFSAVDNITRTLLNLASNNEQLRKQPAFCKAYDQKLKKSIKAAQLALIELRAYRNLDKVRKHSLTY